MRLTENFTLKEMLFSQTAVRRGIKEQFAPPKTVVANLQLLAEKVLQPLRDAFGSPITVTSGYRSPALNAAIGGSRTSQHMKGQAADIVAANGDNKGLFEAILELAKNEAIEFDQLIWEFGDKEPDWIHISYKKTGNRGQVLRATKNSRGKTVYKTIQ